jgi:hypothetical protein
MYSEYPPSYLISLVMDLDEEAYRLYSTQRSLFQMLDIISYPKRTRIATEGAADDNYKGLDIAFEKSLLYECFARTFKGNGLPN